MATLTIWRDISAPYVALRLEHLLKEGKSRYAPKIENVSVRYYRAYGEGSSKAEPRIEVHLKGETLFCIDLDKQELQSLLEQIKTNT